MTHNKDDAYITSLILMARVAAEDFTRRAFLSQEWRLTMDAWPVTRGGRSLRRIELDRSPLISVDEIKYYPSEDEENQLVLSVDEYVAAAGLIPGVVQLKAASTWPSLAERPDAVTIDFTAGFSDATLLPEPLRQAILLIMANFYEIRTPVNVGNLVTEVPLNLRWLLQSYRVSGYIS